MNDWADLESTWEAVGSSWLTIFFPEPPWPTVPVMRVEVGFDLSDVLEFFRLDDNVQGRLDNTEYRLAGTQFYDVTEYVSGINIQRGKQPIETNYSPGEAEIQFNNHNRYFDPLYDDSPFAGNIIPRREIRVFGNGIEVYRGWIDDWNLSYSNDGDSVAFAKAYDALYLFNNRVIFPFSPVEQSSGDRINEILSLEEVNWPSDQRRIDSGRVTVAARDIEDATDVLTYLQSIAGSDPGDIYIARDGYFVFEDRSRQATSDQFIQFGGTGIPFDNINVSYGAELLFNEIVLTREGGGTVTVSDEQSILDYGARSWSITDSQVSSDDQLVDIGIGLTAKYSTPQYRFDSLDVYMHKLSRAEQARIMKLDFGDVCRVVFHPNNVGDPIDRYVEVINIEHRVDPETHVMTIGFGDIIAAPIVLDDQVFGKLDEGVLSW